MKVIDCVQGSPEWIEARRGLATASCFSQILAGGKGLTREKYRLDLVLERVTGVVRDGFTSWVTKQGQEREPLAVVAYEGRTRSWTTEVGFVRHSKIEAGASPDRFVGEKKLLEIKCPEPLAHLAVLRSRAVPSEYWAQVQGELWICERSELDFVSWNPEFPERHQLVIVPVQRDAKFIDRLRAEVPAFLEEVRSGVLELEALP